MNNLIFYALCTIKLQTQTYKEQLHNYPKTQFALSQNCHGIFIWTPSHLYEKPIQNEIKIKKLFSAEQLCRNFCV